MTPDVVFGEVVLPGVLAAIIYLVAIAALVAGRRYAAGPSPGPSPPGPPRLRVIRGGAPGSRGGPAAKRASHSLVVNDPPPRGSRAPP